MQRPLMEEFKETAQAAYAAFPGRLGRLAVFLAPFPDAPVYVSPEIADRLTKNTAAVKAAVEERANYMKKHKLGGVACRDYGLAGTNIDVIAVKNKTFWGDISGMIFTLDHEIGHLILWNGYPSSVVSAQKAESAADAFAMLRHIQRFGKSADYAGGLAENRARQIILENDPEHYTTDALQMAIRRAEEMGDDFGKLSLQQTAALAEEIADKCCIDNATLSRINNAFWPVHALYNKDADVGTLHREIVSVKKAHRHDPDVVRAANRYLHPQTQKGPITEAALSNLTQQAAGVFINEHQFQINGARREEPRQAPARDFIDNEPLKIVEESAFDAATVAKINDAFKPVRAFHSQRHVSSKKTYNLMLCRMVVAVMREHQDDADIFNAGSRFLSDPGRESFIREAVQSGDPFWHDAVYFMKTHQPKPAKPAKRGILRRLGLRR